MIFVIAMSIIYSTHQASNATLCGFSRWMLVKDVHDSNQTHTNHLLKKTSAENVPSCKSRFISSRTAPVKFLTLLRGTKWWWGFTFLWQVQFHRETQALRVTPWPALSVTNMQAMTLSQGLKYIFYKK